MKGSCCWVERVLWETSDIKLESNLYLRVISALLMEKIATTAGGLEMGSFFVHSYLIFRCKITIISEHVVSMWKDSNRLPGTTWGRLEWWEEETSRRKYQMRTSTFVKQDDTLVSNYLCPWYKMSQQFTKRQKAERKASSLCFENSCMLDYWEKAADASRSGLLLPGCSLTAPHPLVLGGHSGPVLALLLFVESPLNQWWTKNQLFQVVWDREQGRTSVFWWFRSDSWNCNIS